MDDRIITSNEISEDNFDNCIRPQTLEEYIGQSENK